MPTCIQPMSSPMMNRMLGFCCCAGAGAGAGACARAGLRSADAASKTPATAAPNLTQLRCRFFICDLPLLTRRLHLCRSGKLAAQLITALLLHEHFHGFIDRKAAGPLPRRELVERLDV